ncbi:uncharacterized protein B0P05DRAFT_272109 [Gilbertella persicaria]|uniref:uncharacterized protein n=1 Tax=Gilbertella persicaria TaxID=101096 RepID=UPI002220389B|nr:uncharacterized protein B0P05DRAFT_272109 [Gilbertella persicaria]KAI8059405.1 hypothetical protein B0P05DRAFT_272109 [Gilbertella persicaria]
MQNQQIEAHLDSLPTLSQVLARKSQPPVCLYNYYIVLRDRLALETLLDFWLDVAQAEILYNRYLKHSKRTSQPKQAFRPISQYTSLAILAPTEPRVSIATTVSTKKPVPTHADLVEAMERIYARYLIPHAEKEMEQLPFSIKQPIHQYYHQCVQDHGDVIDNPSLIYAEAKEYVYQLLQSTFPLFLRYKVLMNMTLPQQIGRVGVGLFVLLFGFSFEFSLIFLDISPWHIRLWVSLSYLVVLTDAGVYRVLYLFFAVSIV